MSKKAVPGGERRAWTKHFEQDRQKGGVYWTGWDRLMTGRGWGSSTAKKKGGENFDRRDFPM